MNSHSEKGPTRPVTVQLQVDAGVIEMSGLDFPKMLQHWLDMKFGSMILDGLVKIESVRLADIDPNPYDGPVEGAVY